MSDTGLDPMDVLLEVAENVERIASEMERRRELRLNISQGTRFRKIAEYLEEHGTAKSGDLEGLINNPTRAFTTMYYAGYVNRKGGQKSYTYSLSETGRYALSTAREKEEHSQTELNQQPEGEEVKQNTNPWDNTDLNRGQYLALKTVHEYDGHPTSSEIEDAFREKGFGTENKDVIVVSPRLSKLYKKGYVGRPDRKPYIYWVTEDGLELLDN